MVTPAAYGTPGGFGYVDPFAPKPVTPTQPTPAPTPQPTAPVVAKTTPQPTYTPPVPTPQATPQPTNYQKSATESIDQYNARIAAANPNLPAPGTTSPTGVTNTAQAPIQLTTDSRTNAGLLGNTPTTNTNASTPSVTYPGLVSSLSANSLTGSPLAQQAAQGLIRNSQQDPLSSGGGYEVYQKALTDYNKLKQDIAKEYANIGSQAIPLHFQQGRAQVLAQQYASQLDALAQSVSQAQTAMSQSLTLQQQQNTALTSAAGVGTTAQGLLQSGLTSATGYAQPQLASIGSQAYYNPLTNAQTGGNQYGTGPAAAANVASIQELTKQVNDWSSARNSATNLGNQLTSFLQSNQVNPNDFNAVNKFLQAIGAQTSSPQYKQFYNLVTDLANTYAPVLGQGDASNYKVQLAQSLLDGTASGKSIPQILSSLDQQAQGKIQGVQQSISDLENGKNVNTPASSGGGIWNW